jgi:hypothetical protein
MAKLKAGDILQDDLREHPAVEAWCKLQSVMVVPRRIETLKKRVPNETKGGKKFVCRLVGIGPMGSNIIGKRCRYGKAMTERAIYESILPNIPLPTLRYYGMLKEPDGKFCWLFFQDAGETFYLSNSAAHRMVGAKWLAMLHTISSELAACLSLPDRTTAYYLWVLQSARNTILECLSNSTLPAADFMLLEAIVKHCNLLESRWNQLEEFCEEIPLTIVHGDFVGKNLRVRSGPNGDELMVFDWGTAGYGVPASDLAGVDIRVYQSIVWQSWPRLDIQKARKLSVIGKIFRFLAAIRWESQNFKHQWFERPMKNMRKYESWLDNAIRTSGWWA